MSDRLGLVVYVCADRGVPVFGPKGSSGHVRAVLDQLRRRASELHVVCHRAGPRRSGELDGVHVHELGDLPPAQRLDDRFARRVAAIVGARRCDLLYERYALGSCAALELAAYRGWPSVLEINAPLLDEAARHRGLQDLGPAERCSVRAIRAATSCVAVSGPVAEWAERLAARPVGVVPNGVNVERFNHPAPPAGRRVDIAATAPPVTIGFVGSFKPWHDLDTLAEAVVRIHRRADISPLRLLLVGDGPGRPALLDRLATPDLTVDAPGAVPAEAVPALLAEMDVAVAPYRAAEGYFSPLKVFEYLAAGVPVVASAINGLTTVLARGEAVLVAPDDRDAFADALAHLVTDPGARRRVGAAGRRAARQRLGWDRAVDRIVAGATDGRSR